MNIKAYDFYHNLRSLPFVESIWLYGSQARADAKESSDIDLAIFCPKASEDDWHQILRITNNADTLFKIDVIRFDKIPKNTNIYNEILRDKIILFERRTNNYPWYEPFLDLGEALDQLSYILKENIVPTDFIRDATIQRFEFCMELFWKTLKKICKYEQYDVASPRSVLQKSFEMGLITNEDAWLTMLEDRNLASHVYQRQVAIEIFQRIDSHYKHMKEDFLKIKKRYGL